MLAIFVFGVEKSLILVMEIKWSYLEKGWDNEDKMKDPPLFDDILLDNGSRITVGFKHYDGRYYEGYYSCSREFWPVRWSKTPKPLFEE